ncbi:TIM barrel protein [bacterium]|nr:TIM barrel protein [bacterium]
MKLGIAIAPKEALPSAFVVFRDDIETSMKKAHDMGFDGVELALLDSSQIKVEAVGDLCQKFHLDIPMISSGQVYAQGSLCFSSPDKEVRDEAIACIKTLIDLAERFGSMVNIGRVRGPIEPNEPYEISENRFLDSLDVVAQYAAPKGVVIAVEPVNRYELNFINRVDEAFKVISKLSRPNIKIMPDTFHMNIEESSIEATFLNYKDYIVYIHFADSNRLAPGMGHLNFPNIINVLKTAGYEGYVTAEILPHPTPDEAAMRAAKYLKTLLT